MTFVPQAWPFVAPLLIAALLFVVFHHPFLALAALVLAFLVLLFFRDPKRTFRGNNLALMAPADGLITAVEPCEDAEVGPGARIRVVTFLSVFDVHVQRAPAAGLVVNSVFRRGRKVAAFRTDAGEINEAHLTVLETADGTRIGVRQLAGLVARRVVPYLSVGQEVSRGDRLGVIKFGSRVDLILPPDYQVLVAKGDRVRTGATTIASPPADQ